MASLQGGNGGSFITPDGPAITGPLSIIPQAGGGSLTFLFLGIQQADVVSVNILPSSLAAVISNSQVGHGPVACGDCLGLACLRPVEPGIVLQRRTTWAESRLRGGGVGGHCLYIIFVVFHPFYI